MGIEKRTGEKIRRLRKARHMTMADLAEAAGISKALLSKIENGRVSSPITTYERIAKQLGTSLGALFQEAEKDPGCLYVPKGTTVSAENGGYGYRFEKIGEGWPNDRYIPFLLTYYPLDESEIEISPGFSGSGEEFFYILEGELEMHFGGNVYTLKPGDSFFLRAEVPHGGRAKGGKKAVALMIAVPE
jgi:transcriptional regulator with XRE-family HTH domain